MIFVDNLHNFLFTLYFVTPIQHSVKAGVGTFSQEKALNKTLRMFVDSSTTITPATIDARKPITRSGVSRRRTTGLRNAAATWPPLDIWQQSSYPSLHNLNCLYGTRDSRTYDTPCQALFLHLVRLPPQQQGYMDIKSKSCDIHICHCHILTFDYMINTWGEGRLYNATMWGVLSYS